MPRHTATVRLTHWTTAGCLGALLVSGLEIVVSHPRFYWGETGTVLEEPLFSIPLPSSRPTVPTGYGCVLPDQNGWSRSLHFQAARLLVLPGARYVAYYSTDPESWETIDIAEALHPQTLVTLGMNGADLPVAFGGPLRLRVPRQLGYKSVKYVVRVDVVDSVGNIGKGLGGANPEYGYAWYAGI